MEDSELRDVLLDNVIWHALRGRMSKFVAPRSTHAVLQFDSEVSPFSAIEVIGDKAWESAAEVVGPEGVCGFFRDAVPTLPEGWDEVYRKSCFQMVAGDLRDSLDLEVLELGSADSPEMVALAELTEPGPFGPRTFELGRYIGVRREGRLVAMAGERFRIPGYIEISAVCTHPEARGEGLAAELTLNLVSGIREGGDEAFLHVLEDNTNAVRLYQKIGFVIRRSVDVVFGYWRGTASPNSSANTSTNARA